MATMRRYFFSIVFACTVLTPIAIAMDEPRPIIFMPHQPAWQWAPRNHIPLTHQRIRYQSRHWHVFYRLPERRVLQFSLNRT